MGVGGGGGWVSWLDLEEVLLQRASSSPRDTTEQRHKAQRDLGD